MSRPAAITAFIYLLIALTSGIKDSFFNQHAFGNGLRYMMTFLITFPVSVPMALLRQQPDLSNRWTMAAVILTSTAIVYMVVALLVRLAALRFASR